jgi:7-carboxy-7-deazaguanine synthase
MDSTTYDVNDVYVSIQGEGHFTGVPMVVVRLQGCPVGCVFCDTKETWDRANMATEITGGSAEKRLLQLRHGHPNWTQADPTELAAFCRSLAPRIQWILLTGGEPAEQPLKPLIDALHDKDFRVSIETSGTAIGHLYPLADMPEAMSLADWTCVSPKVNNPGGRAIDAAAIQTANEIKWLVGKAADISALHTFLDTYSSRHDCEIALQPISANAKATELCLDAARAFGYRVSIQIHKILAIP